MVRLDIPEMEREIREFWREHNLLEMIRAQNEGGERYFLLDGPPYANYTPHVGHIRNTVYKDLYIRYALMQGKSVLFQPGFDTHGLPIENMVEKSLNLTSKKDIEEMGIAEFTRKCKESATLNKDLWLEAYDLLGSWYSWKEPYLTYDNSYIQSAWWAFKKVWDSDGVYEGKRPVHWCPHCQTSLAGYEVTDSYKVVSDPGVYVKFKLRDREDTYLLAFTTTPWTLPSNVALAVNGDEIYAKVRVGKEHLIIAKALLPLFDRIGTEHEVVEEFKGSELDGIAYDPLIDCPLQEMLKAEEKAHKVIMSIPILKERVASKVGSKKGIDKKDLFEDFVTVDTGTGIVHTAPGHGKTDNLVGKHYGLPEVSPLDDEARFTEEAAPYEGQQVRDASHKIADDLHAQGKLLHYERIEHSYPLCWRCKTPLIFRLSRQWFIKIDPVKEALLQANDSVRWQPEFARERMAQWVANADDWNFSRQRYWGIPIPIWICEECDKRRVIAGKDELVEAAGVPDDIDLHAAGAYEMPCECGGTMRKVPEIFDVWYDAGCAPFASLGYPYKNKELFENNYPVSRINESQDQVRGWFYHLLFVGQLAFGKPPLEKISMPGWVVDKNGDKMSKSVGNVVFAKDALEEFGADPVRFYYCWDVAPHQLQKFNKDTLRNEIGKFFSILWNLVSFVEQLRKQQTGTLDEMQPEDKWLESRKSTVLEQYYGGIEQFELHEGCRALYDFVINDVSRTYVQFTRERSEETGTVRDVLEKTLRDILVALAPITPHFSEACYKRLRTEEDPPSVHLCKLPSPGVSDKDLEAEFLLLQEIIGGILAARDKAQIGLRWPIPEARTFGQDRLKGTIDKYQDLLCMKTNSKTVGSEPLDLGWNIKPDYSRIGKLMGEETAEFLEEFERLKEGIASALSSGERYRWKEHDLSDEHFKISKEAPEGWICMPAGDNTACISLERTAELDREGYARELTRRIQQLRKEAGLAKQDRIDLVISLPEGILKEALQEHTENICQTTGAESLTIDGNLAGCAHKETGSIRESEYSVGFSMASRTEQE